MKIMIDAHRVDWNWIHSNVGERYTIALTYVRVPNYTKNTAGDANLP
jgi:hypothetical protein